MWFFVSCCPIKKKNHSPYPSYFITFLYTFRGFKRKLFFMLLNQVESFVVLTDEMRKNMQELFPNMRISILNNPKDLKEMINKNGIVRANNILLYFGWYIRTKGVYELVDAFDILRNCRKSKKSLILVILPIMISNAYNL